MHITTRPEFDVLVLVSRPRHQDLWSQGRDQDQDLFSQDRDQDQDLKIRSLDGLETKTCLEKSHNWLISLSITLTVEKTCEIGTTHEIHMRISCDFPIRTDFY